MPIAQFVVLPLTAFRIELLLSKPRSSDFSHEKMELVYGMVSVDAMTAG